MAHSYFVQSVFCTEIPPQPGKEPAYDGMLERMAAALDDAKRRELAEELLTRTCTRSLAPSPTAHQDFGVRAGVDFTPDHGMPYFSARARRSGDENGGKKKSPVEVVEEAAFGVIGAGCGPLDPWTPASLRLSHRACEPGKHPAGLSSKGGRTHLIIKGSEVARMGRRSVRLMKGDSLLIHPPTPHGFVAGRSGMTFLAVLSPRVDSQTDYYSCSGHRHAPPRALSDRSLK